jgi:hypothetical protein
MGLDMYLYRKTYVKQWSHIPTEKQWSVSVRRGGKKSKLINSKKIAYVTESLHDWRKFNALHKWFVDNCQGGMDECQETYVGEERLKELLDILKRVDANHSLAAELLPTESGFFFGGTAYDEWYFNDVKDTIKVISGVLKETDFYCSNIIYQSSW